MINFRTGNKTAHLDPWYSTQEDHVFYENHLIFKADTSTFQSLSNKFGKDQMHIYYKGEVLYRADYQTFKVDAQTGIGEDDHGLKIFDPFGSQNGPVYYLDNLHGIRFGKGPKLTFGLSREQVSKELGSPWEVFTTKLPKDLYYFHEAKELRSLHYRHIGLTLSFNEQKELVHYQFRPDYDHPLGCKLLFQSVDLFNISLRSLKLLRSLGFEFKQNEDEEVVGIHPGLNLGIVLYSGKKMNLPSGQDIYPERSFFIVDCQLFPKETDSSMLLSCGLL